MDGGENHTESSLPSKRRLQGRPLERFDAVALTGAAAPRERVRRLLPALPPPWSQVHQLDRLWRLDRAVTLRYLADVCIRDLPCSQQALDPIRRSAAREPHCLRPGHTAQGLRSLCQ